MSEFQPRENLTNLTVETILLADVDNRALAMAQELDTDQIRDRIAELYRDLNQLPIHGDNGEPDYQRQNILASIASAEKALQIRQGDDAGV